MRRWLARRSVLALAVLAVAGACNDSAGPLLIDSTISVPAPPLVSSTPIPPLYGIHDTYIRDGIAFVCAWNTGLILYDVGNGIKSGGPANPVEISRIVTNANSTGLPPSAGGVSGGPAVHNAWWFHNPVTSAKRYVFVGQEGPASLPSSSSGDIHVIDVSNLALPTEVAFYHISGAGTHNFWMDEPAQILYAAYYNAGVVALDVSGTLSGDLATKEIARFKPAPTNTFMWGVQLFSGSLYAIDLLSGFYQLKLANGAFSTVAGGGNVNERYSSDLWVNGQYAYTGTWGSTPRAGVFGNAIKIWRLGTTGAPTLADSVIIVGIQTVSDVKGSDDGKLLVVSAEKGASAGLYLFSLASSGIHPVAEYVEDG